MHILCGRMNDLLIACTNKKTGSLHGSFLSFSAAGLPVSFYFFRFFLRFLKHQNFLCEFVDNRHPHEQLVDGIQRFHTAGDVVVFYFSETGGNVAQVCKAVRTPGKCRACRLDGFFDVFFTKYGHSVSMQT